MKLLQVLWIVCHHRCASQNRTRQSTLHIYIDLFPYQTLNLLSNSPAAQFIQTSIKVIETESKNSVVFDLHVKRSHTVALSISVLDACLSINWVHKFILIWKWVNKINKLATRFGVCVWFIYHMHRFLVSFRWFCDAKTYYRSFVVIAIPFWSWILFCFTVITLFRHHFGNRSLFRHSYKLLQFTLDFIPPNAPGIFTQFCEIQIPFACNIRIYYNTLSGKCIHCTLCECYAIEELPAKFSLPSK